MIFAVMGGDPKAEFKIRLQEYKNLKELSSKYRKAFRKFAEDECPLYKGEWEGNPFKSCRSAIHPDGYGQNKFCNIENCTWHIEEAHKYLDRKVETKECTECDGNGFVMSDYPYSETCPVCEGEGNVEIFRE